MDFDRNLAWGAQGQFKKNDKKFRLYYQHPFEDESGARWLLNRFDGSILSMNSNPTYDAQVFEDRQNDTINSLLNDPEKPLLNRAFTGFYPPGSVFKPNPALLGLKKNIISEKTEIIFKKV